MSLLPGAPFPAPAPPFRREGLFLSRNSLSVLTVDSRAGVWKGRAVCWNVARIVARGGGMETCWVGKAEGRAVLITVEIGTESLVLDVVSVASSLELASLSESGWSARMRAAAAGGRSARVLYSASSASFFSVVFLTSMSCRSSSSSAICILSAIRSSSIRCSIRFSCWRWIRAVRSAKAASRRWLISSLVPSKRSSPQITPSLSLASVM
mmetsp:Transcript_29250/g.85064  ORF Transcript_29250/g.85064 Transcript_29250/m.85064 type:complete len:210 (-) Transcript_29250:2114-2743(-)